MEAKVCLIEPLLESAEGYSKTSLKLIKLKFVDKTSDVMSTLVSRLLLAIALLFFVIILNIAVALWLGDLLGKDYYGFLIVASFYGLIAIILFYIHPFIKARVSNSIVKKMLN